MLRLWREAHSFVEKVPRTYLSQDEGSFYFCHWIFWIQQAGSVAVTLLPIYLPPKEGGEKRGREKKPPVLLMYFDRTPQFDQINISNRDALSRYDTIWYGLPEDFIHLFILRDCERTVHARIHYPSKCIFIKSALVILVSLPGFSSPWVCARVRVSRNRNRD